MPNLSLVPPEPHATKGMSDDAGIDLDYQLALVLEEVLPQDMGVAGRGHQASTEFRADPGREELSSQRDDRATRPSRVSESQVGG